MHTLVKGARDMGSRATTPKIGKITFAIVDIKGGRKALAKLLDGHKQRVPITLAGYLTSQWGGDDGTSIEFEMDVRRQRIKKPIPHTCHCVRCEAHRVEPKSKGDNSPHQRREEV